MSKSKTQFGIKSKDAVNKLVEESRTGRKNSYKYFSIIFLDYYIRLGNHDARIAGFFGEHIISISDSAKQSILKFVADNKYDVKASSETTVRKCWGQIKTAARDHKLATVVAESDHKSIDANSVLKLIEDNEITISIVNAGATIQVKGKDDSVNWRPNNPTGSKGVIYNATRELDGTVVLKTKRDGTLSKYVLKVTKPEECKNASQVKVCRTYWKAQIEKAESELLILKPMLRGDKFKTCNR